MERPSSRTNDSSSRVRIRSEVDTEEKERYYDRMTLRGIPVLRDTDAPEEAPVWRGDHTFNSDAASYSLVNFIEPEVARQHPDWTREQVERVATQRFEERLAQDLSYEHKESAHEESVVYWQPIQTKEGSWELATQYGDAMVTLSELWEHTREYAEFAGNPAAYNPEEHRLQIQMQEEIISGGAKGFVSVLSHPDAIRYVQVWQKTDDGSIVSKQVDLYKTTGRDFSHDEGEKLIDHLRNYFKEDVGGGEASVVSYAHIYIHEKSVSEEDIRTIAIAQVMEVHEHTGGTKNERYVPKISMRVGEKTVRDTTESMVQLGAFLREHIDRKISDFKKRDPDVKKKTSDVVLIQVSHERPAHTQTEKTATLFGASPDTQSQPIEMMHTTDTMKSMLADWWIISGMMPHKDTIPVASTAIIYWLMDSMTSHTTEVHAEKIPALGEKDGPTEPTTMQRLGVSIRNAFSFMVGNHEVKKSVHRHEKHRGMLRHDVVKRSSIHKGVIEGAQVNQEVPLIILSKSTSDTLMSMLQKLLGDDHLVATRSESVHKDMMLVQKMTPTTESTAETLPVTYIARQLGIAVIIWLLTEHARSVSFKKNLHLDIGKRGTDSLMESLDIQDERTSQWLLLSIVWYMTALREHGKQNTPNQKISSKKQKKQQYQKIYTPLPLTGIIFTFGS